MRRVSIAAPTRLAAEAGAGVADAGGNAVDAALAATVVGMCTELGIVAPGASGFVTVWPAGGSPIVIDAYAEMPGRGLPPAAFGRGVREIHMAYGGSTRTMVGWGSVATPGAFAGFEEACRRFGSAPWPEVLRPAVEVTCRGFPLSSASAEYLRYSHELVFGWHPEVSSVVHHDDGTPVGEGDRIHLPRLSATLERIAAAGAAELYVGDLGQSMARAVLDGEGILTERDLAAYRPVARKPILLEMGEWTVATNPAPAVGGAVLAAMLHLLGAAFPGWTPEGVRRFVEVQRAVLGYRRTRLHDHAEREGAIAELLDLARRGDPAAIVSPSTIHTSAVDTDGTACAVTVSAGYGSGATVPGTGFWLNNSLGELELVPEGIHGLPPGTRLASNMAPTVARRADGSVLAIGSPGADRITTALATVLVGFLLLDEGLNEAVRHPRAHLEIFDGVPTVAHEPGLAVEPFDGLAARRFPDLSMYFGGVQAALWDPVAGLFGAADPRRSGAVARGGTA